MKLTVRFCTGPGAVNKSEESSKLTSHTCIPYLLDQTPLSISRRSQIVAAPQDVLNEIVAALKY